MLWEKKKFVLKTDYVITIDRIPEEFYPEILKNKEQLKEWKDLGFGKIKSKNDLIAKRDLMNTEYKKLPVDTKYFSEDFKERLLEKLGELGNIDDLIDGILIKSENWQALNLLLEKYKEKVQTIYIDPPFNKADSDQFLYKANYKDSSWLTLLENRLQIAKALLNRKGNIFVNSDDQCNSFVRLLLDIIFNNFQNEIIWSYEKPGAGLGKFKNNHANIYFYTKTMEFTFNTLFVPRKGETELTGRKGRFAVDYKGKISPDWWQDIPSFATAMTAGERTNKMFGVPFPTQQPEKLLKRIIHVSSNAGTIVLDYFLGSGTTTDVAHKFGRKYIGVEAGNHFETVILPRMKKV
jgi:adenine-specific DNA-methyltransferase